MQQWGTPQKPELRPRRDTGVLIMSALIVIAILGTGLYAFSSSKDLQILVGLASRPTPTPRPTATPFLPTPVPTPIAGDPLASFVQLSRQSDLPMHLQLSITITSSLHGGASLSFDGDMKGRSMAGAMSIKTKAQKASGPFIVVSGDWYRRTGQTWNRYPNPGLFITEPSLLPRSGDLGLVVIGIESRAGADLTHLRGTALPAPDFTGSLRASGCGELAPVDFWVRPDGTPVTATYDQSCDYPGNKQSIKITWEFSHVGEPVVIEVPET
jgi:hypothetical protein